MLSAEANLRPCQSGMASQPTRSALMLATLVIGLLCANYVIEVNATDEHTVISTNLIGPRFGDRISPRHRSFDGGSGSLSAGSSRALEIKSNSTGSTSANSNSEDTNLESLFPSLVYNSEHGESDEDTTVTVTQSEHSSSDVDNLLRKSEAIDTNNVELPVIGANQQRSIANGNASSAQAHRLEMSTEFFVVPSTASSVTMSTTVRPGGVIIAAKPAIHTNSAGVTPPTIISAYSASGLRREPWVVPILVMASLAMFMMAAFEIFVLCKAWRTSPSRRHLFLGQMLLLGLFSCAGLAAVLTATPTLLSCATVRFGAGVAFALVFASLLVKCVFLISLNGGVYLPAPYQGLLLLFAVLIQVAIGVQWLLTSAPAVDNVPVLARSGTSIQFKHPLLLTAQDLTTTVPLCKTQFSDLLFSLIYVVFLILFVAVLAIKSRGIRDNYREATYIGLAIGGSIPIWLGWTLCGLAVADRHKDACLAFGLVATSATVFLVMFMPKGRQLAAMGKEGLYVEDREEQFSSLSRAGSGYSPSFFHFKPIKYGVMGPAPTSTTNTGNGTSSKHQAVATLGGGK